MRIQRHFLNGKLSVCLDELGDEYRRITIAIDRCERIASRKYHALQSGLIGFLVTAGFFLAVGYNTALQNFFLWERFLITFTVGGACSLVMTLLAIIIRDRNNTYDAKQIKDIRGVSKDADRLVDEVLKVDAYVKNIITAPVIESRYDDPR